MGVRGGLIRGEAGKVRGELGCEAYGESHTGCGAFEALHVQFWAEQAGFTICAEIGLRGRVCELG